MKIVGLAQLEYIYPDGSRTSAGVMEQNDICWPIFRRFFMRGNGTWAIPTKRDATTQNNAEANRWRVFYSESLVHQTKLNAWCRIDGSAAADQDSPTYVVGAGPGDPDILTFLGVIAAPVGASRTIRVLGLYFPTGTGSNVCAESSARLTILRLTTPCVQAENVQLAVTYRLFLYPTVESSNQRVTARVYEDLKQLLKRACDAVGSTHLTYRGLKGNISSTCYDVDGISPMTLHGPTATTAPSNMHELTDNGIMQYRIDDATAVNGYTNAMAYPISLASSHTPSLGVFAKHLWFGDSGHESSLSNPDVMTKGLTYQQLLPGVTDPRQNVYGQRNSPVGPLQDLTVNNIATMSGVLTLDAQNWTDPSFQKLFRIRIGTTGDLSTPATYQVDVFDFTAGFVGNRWVPRTAILPQSIVGGNQFRGFMTDVCYEEDILHGGTAFRSPDGNRYVAAFNCKRTKSGIAIYDILRGSKKVFNANSTPALPVTAVSDGDVTKGYTYVGCANTGLYRISPDLLTVEAIPAPPGVTNNVYQICAKADAAGTLWVLYNGGLCKLSNPNAALGSLSWTVHNPTTGSPTFTYAGITDGNWANVSAMIIDPDNTGDDQFLFLSAVLAGGVTTGNWRLGHVWWSTVAGVAANPTTNGIAYTSFVWTLSNLLRMSDAIRCDSGRWMSCGTNPIGSNESTYHFTYGSNSLNATWFYGGAGTNKYARMIPANIGGNKGFMTFVQAVAYSTPSVFIKTSSVPSLAATGAILTNAHANCEFAMRVGASTYVVAMDTDTTDPGNLARPLLYLPGSNMLFSLENAINAYGVTPFMLQPSHAKYATYESAFWKHYGWTGAAWQKGHSGYRDVHATLETLPDLDGLRASFANGVSGTSFAANEFWTGVVGKGLMKDNGTTYNSTVSLSFDATERLTFSDNVPLTALGALTDEPVTFSPQLPDLDNNNDASGAGIHRCIQNKGILVTHAQTSGANSALVSDQLIPASTDFDFRFKWISFESNNQDKAIGLATAIATPAFTTGTMRFRYNATTGNLEVYNNTTIVGSVIPSPSVDAECRIARVGTTVSAYYNGVLVGTITAATAFVIMTNGCSNTNESGWYDMRLTYTEARRVYRVGDSGTPTGSYSPKFMGLTSTGLVGDTRVYIGTGTPLQAVLDYSTAGNAIAGTGNVKVASGAGWLVFHDSESANAINGYTIAHYVNDTF